MSRRDRVEKKKPQNFSYTSFCSACAVLCQRVSASNFQALPRKSGGARALGNMVRFLAGPALQSGDLICHRARKYDHRLMVSEYKFGLYFRREWLRSFTVLCPVPAGFWFSLSYRLGSFSVLFCLHVFALVSFSFLKGVAFLA